MSRMTIGGLVLAGGSARRMGGMNKALLPMGGYNFLQRLSVALEAFQELLLSTNDPLLAEGTPFTAVPDRISGHGPLEGIFSALSVCQSEGLIVAACDLPLFSRELANCLAAAAQGEKAVACVDRRGNLHPLCGVYTKACLPEMESALSGGMFQVAQVFRAVGGVPFYLENTPLPDALLMNINTPENFAQLLRIAGDPLHCAAMERFPE